MADAITTHAASRRQLQAGKDAQAEASWRERALNGEDALNGRYRTTSRPPTAGLRPLRVE